MNKLDEIIEKNRIQFIESNNNININDLCKTIAIEFAQHVLEEAAENSKTESISYFDGDNIQKVNNVNIWEEGCDVPSYLAITNKESITSVINKYL